jgi:THAP4-like, heme-binding beta-barrel domain
MAEVALHPDLEALAFLLGTWRGQGEGVWGDGDPFTFGEELSFKQAGEPYLLYRQRSWDLDDDGPIHFERGFLRPAPTGRVELVLAHPLGIVEVAEGLVEGPTLSVASTTVALTSTGSPVTDLRRMIHVDDDILTYELHMATTEVPLMSHIRSRLVRS